MCEASNDRLSRLSRTPQFAEGDAVVPLRQPGAVVPEKQRNVGERWWNGPERLIEEELPDR